MEPCVTLVHEYSQGKIKDSDWRGESIEEGARERQGVQKELEQGKII